MFSLKVTENGKDITLQTQTIEELAKVVLSLLEKKVEDDKKGKVEKPAKTKKVDKTIDIIVNGVKPEAKVTIPERVDKVLDTLIPSKKVFKNELPITILRRDGKEIKQTLVSAESVLNPEGNLDAKTIKRRFFGGGSGLMYTYTYFIDGHKVPSFQHLTNLYLYRTQEGLALQEKDRKKIQINGFAYPRQNAKVAANLTWIGHIHLIHEDGRVTNSELKCVGQLAKK